MSESYELFDGSEAEGTTADVMRMLDEHDPLEDPLKLSMNDQETFEEFRLWKPECWWCSDTGVLVTSTGLDNYNESAGERLLYRMLMEFNEGRRTWGIDQKARALADNDKARAKNAEAYVKYVTRANTAGALGQFAKLFKARCDIAASELNTRADVLGTPFGVVDMDVGELCTEIDELGAKKWRVTKRTRANIASRFTQSLRYDQRWEEFIGEIMCGDEEKAAFLQRALGYSMLGGNPEECMFIAYGATTRNGKGTLLNTIVHVLGDYAASMPPNFLLSSRAEGGTDDALASLVGKRFVTTSEPKAAMRLDESKVKALTGNDIVTTSRKYGHTFSFTPEFTMWLSCNRLPEVSDTTVFSSGRIVVIPFERHFGSSERDVHLKDRFLTEDGMHTVLEWLIEGYLMYAERGLDIPESIREATMAYTQVGGSSLTRFVDSRCVVNSGARVENGALKAAYAAFCDEIGDDPMTAQKMRKEFELMSVYKRRSNGKDFWVGIGLDPGVEVATADAPERTESARKRRRASPKGKATIMLR